MNSKQHWKKAIAMELRLAEDARKKGQEGRARVCSRRALGIAIGEYLDRMGIARPGPSAIERINLLLTIDEISEQGKEISRHMLIKVAEDHSIPSHIDLIAESRTLITELLGGSLEI